MASAADIASLRGSEVISMIAYMGEDRYVFAHLIELRPDRLNLNEPFAFTRYATGLGRDG